MEVQPDEDDADFGVDEGGIPCSDALVVFWFYVATVGWVCAADEGDVLGAEFLLDACFADHIDFALVCGELEDARDVD